MGKDTIIRLCIDILRPEMKGLRIVRRGFSDKIYDVCHMLYGWAGFQPRTYYADHPQSKANMLANGKTVRDMLIEIGTPVMRAYDENVWINAALKTNDYDILFVNDLRFPNEFDAIRKLGGKLIKIVRPGLPEPTDVADTALNGCDKWDEVINNDGDLDNLWKHAQRLVQIDLLGR